MTWTNLHLTYADADYLTTTTRKVAASIQKRIDALVVAQDEVTKTEIQFREAPLSKLNDWGSVGKRRIELLVDEMKIRQDMREWFRLFDADRQSHRANVAEKMQTAITDARDALFSIGYTEESLIGTDILLRHPQVKSLRLEEASLHDVDYRDAPTENVKAIEWIEAELTSARERLLG